MIKGISLWLISHEFYTRFIFKIDALPQDVVLPIYITATFFNNLSPNTREFLISEGLKVNLRSPIETHHQGNQRLILVKIEAVEAENKTMTTKAAV